MTEEQPKKKKKLPANFLVDVYAEQQNITLDRLNKSKGGEENERNANDGSTS